MSILIKQGDVIPDSIDDIFADDDLGLFANVKAAGNDSKDSFSELSSSDRVLAFVREHQRLPDDSDPGEFAICLDFQEVKDNHKDIYEQCLKILGQDDITKKADNDKSIQVSTATDFDDLDDIFNDDDFGLLDYDKSSHDIFNTNEVKSSNKTVASSVDGKIEYAQNCKDFYRYEKFFNDLFSLIKSKDLDYIPIRKNSWKFNIGDVLLIKNIHRIVVDEEVQTFVTGHGTNQRRISIVYENELINKPFDSSLSRECSRDKASSRVIAKTTKGINFLKELKDSLVKLKLDNTSNVLTGYIYILKSLSTNSKIQNFVQSSHLVKIGYCTTSIEERIKNCKHDPTYLEGEVAIVASYRCYNFDPHKLERLIHAFLGEHKLNVELVDANGKKYKPKEWFTVSLKIACETVERIIDGTIHKYRIDPIQGKLIAK